MIGIVYLLLFFAGGMMITRFWLPRRGAVTRWFVGAAMGLLLMMWLPALWAYAVTFSLLAHGLAGGTLGLLVVGAYASRDKAAVRPFGTKDKQAVRLLLFIALPLTILAGYLEYTHSIPLAADGTYRVGQSTYGDLSLHLAVATSAVNAAFPLENSLMVGATMAYPYLSDTVATSMYMLGMNLNTAMAFTGTVMCAIVFSGYTILAVSLCRKRGAAALAILMLFLNGGLGFFYTLSGWVEDGVTTTFWDNLQTIITGYYKTPTNQPDPYNLRWVNIICDMLIPQRGFLGGWTMLMPVFLLVLQPLKDKKKPETRAMISAGVIAGGMPLLHTHSFLALGLSSIGFCTFSVLEAPKGRRMEAFKPFLWYGGIAAALSLPQLINLTFVQATSSDHFLRFQFNWCNNRSGNGLVEPYFWFYIKNIGLPYLLILLALFQRKRPIPPALAAAAQDSVTVTQAYDADGGDESTAAENAANPIAESPAQAAVEGNECIIDPQLDNINEHNTAVRQIQAVPSNANRVVDPQLDEINEHNTAVRQAQDVPSNANRVVDPQLDEINEHNAAVRQAQAVPSNANRVVDPQLDELNEHNAAVRQYRLIALGAFIILLIAELIIFQPNEYDNNKLIYVWFLLCLPMAADYLMTLYEKLKGVGGRRVMAVLVVFTLFFSAALTIAREWVSDYQAYNAEAIAAGDYIIENTPEHCVFLTGTQHLNPVVSLAGRTIVCGSDLYLYFHGFTTTGRKAEIEAFYEDPAGNLDLLDTYGVSYIYVSSYERASYAVDEDALDSLFTRVYESESGGIIIWDCTDGDDTE